MRYLTDPMLSEPGGLRAHSVCLHYVLSNLYIGGIFAINRTFLLVQRLTINSRKLKSRDRTGYWWKAIVE